VTQENANAKETSLQQLRHWRVRKKVTGTSERPRMSVAFTGTHIYVQIIDDSGRQDLWWQPPRAARRCKGQKLAANVASAKTIGARRPRRRLTKGIKAVVFDRGGARYHGKVKALADAAREAGLQF
jgi:large subunit ribosomal protein L18